MIGSEIPSFCNKGFMAELNRDARPKSTDLRSRPWPFWCYAIPVRGRFIMSGTGGPWHRPDGGGASRIRFVIWIVLLLAIAGGLYGLSTLFPDQVSDDFDKAYLFRGLAVLGVVSAGIVYGRRRIHLKEVARNIAIWIGVFLVLAVGFAYQDELRAVALRLRSELIPGYAVETGPNELVLTESPGGNFYVFGAVNGAPVKFLIDTGASDIVLSPGDAGRAGIDIAALDYSRTYQTANGVGLGATVTVHSIEIGGIGFSDVPVSVNKSQMSESLLGMPFLKRMASVEIRGRQLYLHWRK
jgi:aspartyl protease family protein